MMPEAIFSFNKLELKILRYFSILFFEKILSHLNKHSSLIV
jgi:hypothetical protein